MEHTARSRYMYANILKAECDHSERCTLMLSRQQYLSNGRIMLTPTVACFNYFMLTLGEFTSRVGNTFASN